MREPPRPASAEERNAQRRKDTFILVSVAFLAGMLIACVLWYLHIFETVSG